MVSDALTASRTDSDGGGRVHAVVSPAADSSQGDPLGVLMHISHEIRTPLNSILALSQLLRDGMAGALNAEQQKYVEVIERNGHNLLRLVSDVLDLSRLRLGYLEMEVRPCDLSELIQATAVALAPLAAVKKIDLIVTPLGNHRQISCDPDRVRQILTNLIGNAIKYTDRGRVTLSTEWHEQRVSIHVSDTGVGIPRAAQARLFEEFFQAGETDSRRRAGAGLGLAIARRLATLMGGDLSVRSDEGAGSRFTLTVPTGRQTDSATDEGAGTHPRVLAGEPGVLRNVSEDAEEAEEEAEEAGGEWENHRVRNGRHGTNSTGR